jgi:acyl-CoA thioesterase I
MRVKHILMASILLIALWVPLSGTQTIVFLGDSLTKGHRVPEALAYPGLIQKKLHSDQMEWVAINAGKNGDTTLDGIKRLKKILKKNPKIIVIALGANDYLKGYTLEKTRNNLKELIESVQKNGSIAILFGTKVPSHFSVDDSKASRRMFESLAHDFDIRLYPNMRNGIEDRSRFLSSDGLHPNELGQIKMAENIYDFLLPTFLTTESQTPLEQEFSWKKHLFRKILGIFK